MLEKIKAVFNTGDPVIQPAQPVVQPAAAAPVTLAAKPYKLKDGTDISISQAGDTIAVGDSVIVNGVPATEGTLMLEDGTTLSIDATGKITLIVQPEPVTTDLNTTTLQPTTPAPVIVAPVLAVAIPKTPEELKTLLDSFANGSPEERLTNVELVAKALMENVFGWQIREAEQKANAEQAINIYKTGLATTQAQLEKHEQTIKDMFALIEVLVKEPMTDPVTLTPNKKEQFDRSNNINKRLEQIGNARRNIKALA